MAGTIVCGGIVVVLFYNMGVRLKAEYKTLKTI